jgi:hypothetical protein
MDRADRPPPLTHLRSSTRVEPLIRGSRVKIGNFKLPPSRLGLRIDKIFNFGASCVPMCAEERSDRVKKLFMRRRRWANPASARKGRNDGSRYFSNALALERPPSMTAVSKLRNSAGCNPDFRNTSSTIDVSFSAASRTLAQGKIARFCRLPCERNRIALTTGPSRLLSFARLVPMLIARLPNP